MASVRRQRNVYEWEEKSEVTASDISIKALYEALFFLLRFSYVALGCF